MAKIIELTEVIQGEGKLAGRLHLLVRMTGCPLRCKFQDSICDTSYAWNFDDNDKSFDLTDFENALRSTKAKYVMITGGEPTMDMDMLLSLIYLSHRYNKHVTIETMGYQSNADLDIDLLSLSPKLTNSIPFGTKWEESHDINRQNYNAMRALIHRSKKVQLKFVVSSNDDIEEIKRLLSNEFPDVSNNDIWLMPEGDTDEKLNARRRYIADKCIENGWNYTDRLHIIIYGNDSRGK